MTIVKKLSPEVIEQRIRNAQLCIAITRRKMRKGRPDYNDRLATIAAHVTEIKRLKAML